MHELVGPVEHKLVRPVEHKLVRPVEHELVRPAEHQLVRPANHERTIMPSDCIIFARLGSMTDGKINVHRVRAAVIDLNRLAAMPTRQVSIYGQNSIHSVCDCLSMPCAIW